MRMATAHTPWRMKERVARLATGAMLTLLLAGCSVVLPRPAAPEAGSTREEARLRRDLCLLSACPATVDIGPRRFQVKSQNRQSTLDEAIGRRKQSPVGRALTAIGDGIVRDLGGTTTRTLVVTSTHTVAEPSLALLLDCEAVWIGEEHQEEVPAEERLDNSPPGQQRVSRWRSAAGSPAAPVCRVTRHRRSGTFVGGSRRRRTRSRSCYTRCHAATAYRRLPSLRRRWSACCLTPQRIRSRATRSGTARAVTCRSSARTGRGSAPSFPRPTWWTSAARRTGRKPRCCACSSPSCSRPRPCSDRRNGGKARRWLGLPSRRGGRRRTGC